MEKKVMIILIKINIYCVECVVLLEMICAQPAATDTGSGRETVFSRKHAKM